MSVRPAHNHDVQFYDDDSYMCAVVAAYLGEGLRVRHSVLAIVTPIHRELIVKDLESQGFDIEVAIRSGQLILLDARETLSAISLDGMPEAERFRRVISEVLDTIRRHRYGMAIRAFGEMVDVLWREGNVMAAIRLEDLWNELRETQSFALLCAYSISGFPNVSASADYDSVCAQHAHALPSEVHVLQR